MGLFDSIGSGSSLSSRVGTLLGDTSQKVTDVFSGSLDPSNIRRSIAGLFPGAMTTYRELGDTRVFTDDNGTSGQTHSATDWRIKVGLPQRANILYQGEGSYILTPLINTGGVIFPYTPSITVSHKANYQPQRLTHSNYAAYFYEGSEVNAIQITGDFTVQNQAEGQYLFAAIHFFRAATKMFFGATTEQYQGNPPPILQLSGYGEPYFPNVKCVLTDFSHTMPPDVDYMSVAVGQHTVRLPTSSQIVISLQPVFSRQQLHNDFSLEKFANGSLMGKGFI